MICISMIPIFDLDDTLYPEETFVQSGFRAVAHWLKEELDWDALDSLEIMNHVLAKQGRGAVFDALLQKKGMLSKQLVKRCVRVYRHHTPSISLFPAAVEILAKLDKPLYLVTDGHKIAQRNKIKALGIETCFRKAFITHYFGINRAKPSTYCFDKIRMMEKCQWRDLVYVGDNPAKDFVNLNPLGCVTIRVLTGEHGGAKAKPGHDAQHRIGGLSQLPELLNTIAKPVFGKCI